MFTLQILHASDLEGGVDAIENAPNFAAVVEALEAEAEAAGTASILLSAGDNYIPGPFFNAGGDAATLDALEGFYNALFGLIDESVLGAGADANGDGFHDNAEIDAYLAAQPGLSASDVYTTDVNGDGYFDYFDEIDAASGRIDIAIMNALGFDASAVGNHEFDAGADAFENIVNYDSEEGADLSPTDESQVLAEQPGHANYLQEVDTPGAQFPYLSANLDFSADGDLGALFTSDILTGDAFRSDLAGARADAGDPAATGPDGNDAKFAPAAIVEVPADGGTERVGVVGATTQLIETISSVGDVVETTSPGVNDMAALAAALQPQVDALTAQGVNKIVLVSHLQQISLETELAGLLRGVDVIVAGGSDTLLADGDDALRDGDAAAGAYPRPATDADGNPTLIVSTDGEYSYVGRLTVTFDDDGVVDLSALDETTSGAYATDADGVAAVDGDVEAGAARQVGDLAEVVTGIVTVKDGDVQGEAEVFLNGEREDVRTQQTNLGDLSADANLAAARAADASIMVSIKNGGGIRDSIGSDAYLDEPAGPTEANPVSGKAAGEISTLDIENALRFDNSLATLSLTPEQLKMVLEHAVAATEDGATPGQFPQIGGMAFAFDPTARAQVMGEGGTPTTEGERVKTIALLDDAGEVSQVIYNDGAFAADAPASIGVVTLGFLAEGGDGYPFADFAEASDLGLGEQAALADFLSAEHSGEGPEAPAYDDADTPVHADERIVNLAERTDPFNPVELSESFTLEQVWRHQHETDPEDDDSPEGGSEVVSHDDGTLVVTNGNLERIDVLDAADGTLKGSIDLSALEGFDGVQSVAIKNGVVAAAIQRGTQEVDIFGESVEISQRGFVAFFDAESLELLSRVDVGSLPDAVAFSPDGKRLLAAGEGEFNADSDYVDDPLGTVSIIDLEDPSAPQARILDFTAYNGFEAEAEADGLRLKDGTSFAADAEPEYVAVSPDGKTAYATLQENNGIAVIDLEAGEITDVFGLGTRDFSSPGNQIDADDNGVIEIRSFDDLVGWFMPDALATAEIGGETYLLTANEGDSRDFDEARVEDLLEDGLIDPSVDTEGLERLQVSAVDGDTDGDGDIDVLHAFNTRSFSIWDAGGNLVFDSGSMFEEFIAAEFPERFNDDDGDDDENRSDAKGPEPEAIEVGHAYGRSFAFIGLERDSGVFVADISDPANAELIDYMPGFGNDNLAPEVIEFISQADSATGYAQVAVSYEVSGSTAVFDLTPDGGIPEVMGTEAADRLEGEAAAERLFGLAGDDFVFGGGGDDVVRGGEGDDFLRGDAGADILDGGAGDDRIFAGPDDDAGDDIRGGEGDDVMGGGAGDDRIEGGAGDDRAFGGAGDDRLDGGEGADVIWAAAGDDVVLGGAGDDTLGGGDGDDDIAGGAGDDVIWAAAGNDEVSGGAGNDVLWGGTGNDVLTGGAGADVFGFIAGAGDDVATDFEDGLDLIRIEGAAESFAEVTVTALDGDAVLSFGDVAVTLSGVDAAQIGEEDFLFA